MTETEIDSQLDQIAAIVTASRLDPYAVPAPPPCGSAWGSSRPKLKVAGDASPREWVAIFRAAVLLELDVDEEAGR